MRSQLGGNFFGDSGSHGRSMNNAAVDREDGTVTGAVPGPVSVVPSHGTAFVGARCGDSMGSAVFAFPYGDFSSAKIHDGAPAWLDVVKTTHD